MSNLRFALWAGRLALWFVKFPKACSGCRFLFRSTIVALAYASWHPAVLPQSMYTSAYLEVDWPCTTPETCMQFILFIKLTFWQLLRLIWGRWHLSSERLNTWGHKPATTGTPVLGTQFGVIAVHPNSKYNVWQHVLLHSVKPPFPKWDSLS